MFLTGMLLQLLNLLNKNAPFAPLPARLSPGRGRIGATQPSMKGCVAVTRSLLVNHEMTFSPTVAV